MNIWIFLITVLIQLNRQFIELISKLEKKNREWNQLIIVRILMNS
jgi:hypothetical protein